MTYQKTKTIRSLACCAVAILCIVLLVNWWQYYHSPERIRDLAIRALETRDARALYSITGSDEIKALNFSESKISHLLESIKPRGYVGGWKTLTYVDVPVDTRLWSMSHEHEKGRRTRLQIVAIKYEKEGWRLNLTNTLYHKYRVDNGTEGPALYKRNLQSLEIRGILSQFGEADYSWVKSAK